MDELTAQAMPAASAVTSEYGKLRDSVERLRLRHDRLGWAYDITAKVMLLAGITATAVAGVTAAADLLGKAVIGGIAIAAAVVSALAAGLPWDRQAVDHWNLASDYEGLRDEIRSAEIEYNDIESNESPNPPSVRHWLDVLARFREKKLEFDRQAAAIALLHSSTADERRASRPNPRSRSATPN